MMTKTRTHLRRLGTAVLVVMTAAALVGAPVSAQTTAEPAFIVEVHADGSATMSLQSTFDLTTDAEQEAFESLIDDEQAQTNAKDRFLDRMRAVASDAENATERQMRVTDAQIELRRTDDNRTGIVTLTVTWEGLAAETDGELVVTEPFASGFTTERPFTLRTPEGYTIATATPDPKTSTDTSVTWAANTDLTGFDVRMEPSPEPTDSPTATQVTTETGGQPGFGLLVALIALGMGSLWAVRRASR